MRKGTFMQAIQLSFDIIQPDPYQEQLDAMHESMGKMRRSLFAQLGELKKQYFNLKTENEDLREQLKQLTQEKTNWQYGQGNCLFDVSTPKRAMR